MLTPAFRSRSVPAQRNSPMKLRNSAMMRTMSSSVAALPGTAGGAGDRPRAASAGVPIATSVEALAVAVRAEVLAAASVIVRLGLMVRITRSIIQI